MFRFIILVLICCAISLSAGLSKNRSASHSAEYEYGGNGGTPFSHSMYQLRGPITVLRIRADQSQITGLQVRYGRTWSDYVGGQSGDLQTIPLRHGESIIRVSGKADYYIRKLTFLTNFGRRFSFGADIGNSFTALPHFPRAVLSYFSGRSGNYIDAISFHWNVKRKDQESEN